MTQDQLDDWFGTHVCDADGLLKIGNIKLHARDFADAIVRNCPEGADQTAAIRKVREASMTAVAAISSKYPLAPAASIKKPSRPKVKKIATPEEIANKPIGDPLRAELIKRMCSDYEECSYEEADKTECGSHVKGLCLDWSGWSLGYWAGDVPEYRYIWLRKKK